jgi:hypothetical protein
MKSSLIFWKKSMPIVAPGCKRYEMDFRFYAANLAEKCGDLYMANLHGVALKAESARICIRVNAGAADMFEKKSAKQLIQKLGARKAQVLQGDMKDIKVPIVSKVPESDPSEEIGLGLLEMREAAVKQADGTFEIKKVPMLTGKGADLYAEYITILGRKGQKAAMRHLSNSIGNMTCEMGSDDEDEMEEIDEMVIEYV